MLSNGVLERAFLGAEPGELCRERSRLLMAQYKGRDEKFFPVRAAIAASGTKDGGLVAPVRAGKGM